MHRLKPFLKVGLNNFLSLRLQKYKNQRKKTDSIKLEIRTRINTIEIKFAVVYVGVRNNITAPFLMII